MDSKSIFKSKTFWTNALVIVFGALAALGVIQIDDAAQTADTLAGAIVGVIGAINIILRLVTTKPATLP